MESGCEQKRTNKLNVFYKRHFKGRSRIPLRKLIIRKIILLTVIFSLGLFSGIYISVRNFKNDDSAVIKADKSFTDKNQVLTISNIKKIVESASDLISTKYHYTDTDTYENYKTIFGQRIPFTTDKVVFEYDGIISVGIDLSEIEYDVDNKKRRISIILPEVKIISNEIDASSFEYPYVSDSFFNSIGMNDYMELIDKLKKVKAEDIINDKEFMNEALENVKISLENLLAVSEITKDYNVVFDVARKL